MDDLFGDGVFFVAMDGLESGNLVVPAIAAAMQFTFYEQQEQSSQLLNHLAGKRLLLILDNADQLLSGGLVEAILTRAPQVKILATSREALNLQQEWFHPIDGLAVMDKENEAGDEGEAGVADAVRLFQQSARRANPDFDLDRERVHVQRICRLVDGAPLGIELAAAWLKALSCEQIARELEQSLDFLSTSLRNIPDRHRSMRVVLEQTWHYLSAEEQRVFRRLSIFAGGFRADAAQAVAEASLRMLVSLVEKSVLHLAEDGRYRIHSLLRQLAAEKLAGDPSELAAAQARHSTVYMAFLQDRQLSIAGPDQKRVLAEVEEEMDNIRVAWTYAARHQRLDDLVAALPALFRFLWTRGRYEDGERLTAQVLDRLDGSSLTDEQWPAQIALTARRSQLAAARGAHQEALAMLDPALAEARRVGSLPEEALCLYVTGVIADYLGETDGALDNLNAARSLYQQLKDDAGMAETATVLGYAYIYLAGDYEHGQRLVEESLKLFRQIGDLSNIAETLDRIASIHWKLGQLDESEARYQECLAIARDIDQQFVVTRGIGGLGLVAWSRGQLDLAIQLMFERLERMQELGNEIEVYTSVNLLCGIHAHAGRYAEAKRLLDQYPGMQGTYFTAQIHVGAGAYAEAMRYLPHETASMLTASNHHDLASYLNGWAMLLMSDCALDRDGGTAGKVIPLTGEKRIRTALEIVTLLHTYAECRADTRKRAGDLLGQWQDKVQLSQSRAEDRRHEDRSIEKLAEEILTIHLA